MSQYRVAGVLAVATLVMLAVVACTPGKPSTLPSGSKLATSAPSPSYTQPATPASRFSITCDQLTPATAVAALIGPPATPIAPYPDPGLSGGTIENMSNLANNSLVQSGSLECAWSDDSAAPALTIALIPDAASEFSALVPSLFELPEVTGLGDRAYGGCMNSGILRCEFQILVGATWVSISPNELAAKAPTLQSITELARKVVDAVVASPAPSPQWTAPPSSVGTSVSCATLLSAQQLAPFSLPAPKDLHGLGYFGGYLGDTAIAIAGGRECAWGAVSTLIVPGASWAWASHGPVSNTSISVAPVTGLGDSAQVGCSTNTSNTQCTAQILVGSTWVGIDGPFANVDAIVAFAKVELTALKAA